MITHRHLPAGLLAAALLIAGVLQAAPSKGPSALEKAYTARLKEVDKQKADDWLGLAGFCYEQDWALRAQRQDALRNVLKLDSANACARRLLGEVAWEGKWLPWDKAMIQLAATEKQRTAKKEVFYGAAWTSGDEAAAARGADRERLGWEPAVRIDTAHLRLYSDRSWLQTQRWAFLLENVVEAYRLFHGRSLALQEFDPIPVYVLDGKERFAEVTQKVLGRPVHSDQGFYDFNVKILFVNVQDGRPVATDQTAVHELVHGLDNVALKWRSRDIPPWILEGRAIHFGHSLDGAVCSIGSVRPPENDARIDAGIRHDVTFPQLLQAPQGSWFKAGAERQALYAAAWAATHYLFHGEDGKYAEAFRAYLAGLPQKNTLADFEACVGPVAEIEVGLKKHCELIAKLKAKPATPPQDKKK